MAYIWFGVKTMRPVEDIFEDIKDIICFDIRGKVFDKHVADALNINHANFYTMKMRRVYPFEKLAVFCYKRQVSISWLLFRDGPKEISYEQSSTISA